MVSYVKSCSNSPFDTALHLGINVADCGWKASSLIAFVAMGCLLKGSYHDFLEASCQSEVFKDLSSTNWTYFNSESCYGFGDFPSDPVRVLCYAIVASRAFVQIEKSLNVLHTKLKSGRSNTKSRKVQFDPTIMDLPLKPHEPLNSFKPHASMN